MNSFKTTITVKIDSATDYELEVILKQLGEDLMNHLPQQTTLSNIRQEKGRYVHVDLTDSIRGGGINYQIRIASYVQGLVAGYLVSKKVEVI